MSGADQNIAMMDGTYFVGRKEILDWVNGVCATNLTKIEQTCNGAIACMILDAVYPGKVPMGKVDWSANKDYEYVQNYKILQKCFMQLKIDRFIEVDRLIRGKYQDNLEFMQWFKRFYELNASGAPYDGLAQRERGKGGTQYTAKFGGVGGGGGVAVAASAASPVVRKKATVPMTKRAVGTKPPGAPTSLAARAGATNRAASPVTSAPSLQVQKELAELNANNERLTNEVGELNVMVEGLEKERDFYFHKLRQIEETLQALEGDETNELAQMLFKILYAPDDAAGVEGEVEDEMDGEGLPIEESMPMEQA